MSRKRGFTLIEIIIVVAIIALLAAIAIPSHIHLVRRSRVSEAIATMSLVRQALRDYSIIHGTYYDVYDSDDVTGASIANDLPTNVNVGDGTPTPNTAGVAVDVGVAQYFSNAAFSVDAVNHASARFTSPGPDDFVISVDTSDSEQCGDAGVDDDNCALHTDAVTDFRIEMDNTGRVFVLYDAGGNWVEY